MRPFEDTRFILEQRRGPELVDELDPRLKTTEERLRQLRENWDSIRQRALELEEARAVLTETDVFFKQAQANPSSSALTDDSNNRSSFDEADAPLLENALESGGQDGRDLGAMHLEYV